MSLEYDFLNLIQMFSKYFFSRFEYIFLYGRTLTLFCSLNFCFCLKCVLSITKLVNSTKILNFQDPLAWIIFNLGCFDPQALRT